MGVCFTTFITFFTENTIHRAVLEWIWAAEDKQGSFHDACIKFGMELGLSKESATFALAPPLASDEEGDTEETEVAEGVFLCASSSPLLVPALRTYFRAVKTLSNAFHTESEEDLTKKEKTPNKKTPEKTVDDPSPAAKTSGNRTSSRSKTKVDNSLYNPPLPTKKKSKTKKIKKEKVVKKIEFPEEVEESSEKKVKKQCIIKSSDEEPKIVVSVDHSQVLELQGEVAKLREQLSSMRYEQGQSDGKPAMLREIVDAKDQTINSLKSQLTMATSSK